MGVAPIPHDDRTLRLFWLGNQIHSALQTTFPFEVIGHEVPVKNEEYMVSGRIDTLARVEDVVEVVEFKSVNSKKFNYGLPDEHHVMQLGTYLMFPSIQMENTKANYEACPADSHGHNTRDGINCEACGIALGQPYELLPDRGRLVYWSKDDAKMEEFVIKLTPTLEKNIKAEYTRLEALYQDFLKTKALPPAIDDWRVRYCNYAGTGQCCGDKA